MEVYLADITDPATLAGKIFYAFVFFGLALLASRLVRAVVRRLSKPGTSHFGDITAIYFLAQLAQLGIFIGAIILYAHLIPPLRSLGTALLTGVSVVSVIVGLAAQNTLGNLISGISLLLYRPFQLGDRIQVGTPKGMETGIIESLSLGYTIVVTEDNREIVVPNSVMASAVTINLSRRRPDIKT